MAQGKLIESELTGAVIECFFEVYNELGYGFLEHVYISALEREMRSRGLDPAREVGARVDYKGEGYLLVPARHGGQRETDRRSEVD